MRAANFCSSGAPDDHLSRGAAILEAARKSEGLVWGGERPQTRTKNSSGQAGAERSVGPVGPEWSRPDF